MPFESAPAKLFEPQPDLFTYEHVHTDVFTWGGGVFSHYMVMLTFRLCYLHNEIAHMISGV